MENNDIFYHSVYGKESDPIYEFKVGDYTTMLVGRFSVEDNIMYISRGDGSGIKYELYRIVFFRPLNNIEFPREYIQEKIDNNLKLLESAYDEDSISIDMKQAMIGHIQDAIVMWEDQLKKFDQIKECNNIIRKSAW